jgi:hypothetical protein
MFEVAVRAGAKTAVKGQQGVNEGKGMRQQKQRQRMGMGMGK